MAADRADDDPSSPEGESEAGGTPFDALVLCGGQGSRMGNAAKADIVVAGETLLARARAAVHTAQHTVVVGPEVPGGPVAAVAAGLDQVTAPVLVLLACDMPLVSGRTVRRLVDDLAQPGEDADAVLLTDGSGRRQYLAGAYRTDPLRRAVAQLSDPRGRSMRSLVEGLRLREVAAQAEEAMDCDTWSDVEAAVRLLEER
jgi:molybdopterin-guanine dinucleotide biosynthesis protein A